MYGKWNGLYKIAASNLEFIFYLGFSPYMLLGIKTRISKKLSDFTYVNTNC